MNFNKDIAIFSEETQSFEDRLKQLTHLGIGAHQDDLEIMSFHGINECYANNDKWFGGIICTDGSGSLPDEGAVNDSKELLVKTRKAEQEQAARIGNYSFVAQMGYSSDELKQNNSRLFREDLFKILSKTQTEIVYTHNLGDKHLTHVAVTVNVIKVIRELPNQNKPKILYGCEAWRGLDWLSDSDKVVLDVTDKNKLALPLLKVFNSQIGGGKRYDLATIGRRLSNATFLNPLEKDIKKQVWYAMDLTPLMEDSNIDIMDYVSDHIERFKKDIINNLKNFL